MIKTLKILIMDISDMILMEMKQDMKLMALE